MDYDPRTGLPIKKSAQYPYSASDAFTRAADRGPGSNLFGPNYSGPSGGGGGPVTIPGFTPDYASLIQNDPIFGQLKADLAAGGISDAASRAAATQRALIQFGEVPQFDGLAGLNRGFLDSDVNDTTRQLAQRNTESGMSVVARQAKLYQDNLRAIKNALAARGALRSGETGYQLGEAQRGYDTARYDMSQQVLDYIAGAQQGFLAAERQRQAQLAQGAESAYGRQRELNPVVGERVVYPGQPGYTTPASAGDDRESSFDPYAAQVRAFEYANKSRQLEKDLARYGF